MIRGRRTFLATALAGAIGLLSTSSAHAVKLISEEEARMPAAAPMVTRGITRGPAIRQIQPDPASGPVKSPLALKIIFARHRSTFPNAYAPGYPSADWN